MSSIRLQGTSSGYYDLTVPAAAGTNSIDLSNLPVKDSNGNLSVIGDIIRNDTTLGTMKFALQYNGADAAVFRRNNTTGVATISNGYAGAAIDSLNIDLAGRITTPNQPSFMAYGGWSYAASTYIWKGFATVDHNIGSHWNNSTGRFTAPIAGRYMIYATNHHSTTTSYHLWAFLKNGSLGGGNWVQSYNTGGGYNTTSKQQVFNLVAGDYLEVASNATYPNGYTGGYTAVGAYLVG